MDRKHFATEKQIWWELDKKANSLAAQGKYSESKVLASCMRHFKKPTPEECRAWFNSGY